MPPPRNPPEVFEGRADARAWLGARLAERPLSVIWGPLGIGKTGLVLRAVADARPARAIQRSALETPDATSFLVGLARDLAALAGAPLEADERPVTDLVALVVDLAERAGATVLLDDLHALDDAAVEALLLGVHRHGQAARFVALTRARPRHDELADATLRLDPLLDVDVERLLARCAPTRRPDEIAAFARAARGSPFRARRLLLHDGADPGGSPLADASPEVRRVAQAMRVLRIGIEPSPEIARALDDRGLVCRTALGVRLDDRLRKLVDVEPLDAGVARRDALAIVTAMPGAAATFEAVRLAIEDGDEARAAATLDARGVGELFAEGYAASLFDVLGAATSLVRHRFACAEWLVGGPSLAWSVAQPPPLDPETRLAWCRLLVHGGAVARAKEATAALAREGPEELRPRAVWLLADVLRHAGEYDASIACLEELPATTPAARVQRDLRLAAALAFRGDVGRAGALASGFERAFSDSGVELAGVDRLELRRLRVRLATALISVARFRDLERLIGAEGPPLDARTDELFHHLALATERGRFTLARRLLDRVRPTIDVSVNMRFVHGYSLVRLRLAEGDLEGLHALADKLAFDAPSFGQPDIAGWAWCANAAVCVVTRPGTAPAALPAEVAAPGGTTSALLAAWTAILRARAGHAEDRDGGAALPPDVGLVVRRADAEAALARGDLGRAITVLDAAIAWSREEGFAIEEANLLALALDGRLLAPPEEVGGRARVVATANELERVASVIGSARFASEAVFGAWLVADVADVPALLTFADASASPVVRRRAAALLGRDAVLDALDRRVVARFRPAPEIDDGAIVLDLAARTLRLPTGKRVDISAAELPARIIEILVRGGGHATKEDLARGAWDLRSYHPQRDDKRLQVAVHRLRQLVEETPRAPKLLVRDGDGYRLTVPVRVGRLA